MESWRVGELFDRNHCDIFSVKDPDTGQDMVDLIMDRAGAKGTGKWMSQLALDLGVPSTLVTEAVYARCLSAMKDSRVRASKSQITCAASLLFRRNWRRLSIVKREAHRHGGAD